MLLLINNPVWIIFVGCSFLHVKCGYKKMIELPFMCFSSALGRTLNGLWIVFGILCLRWTASCALQDTGDWLPACQANADWWLYFGWFCWMRYPAMRWEPFPLGRGSDWRICMYHLSSGCGCSSRPPRPKRHVWNRQSGQRSRLEVLQWNKDLPFCRTSGGTSMTWCQIPACLMILIVPYNDWIELMNQSLSEQSSSVPEGGCEQPRGALQSGYSFF